MVCFKFLFFLLIHISATTAFGFRLNQQPRSNTTRSVCYGDLGCYIARPGYKILPQSPEKINTTFFLYTRNNPHQAIVLSAANLDDYIDSTKSIKLIIHGFTDRAQNKWIINMTKELLKSEDMCVITVDWSGGNQFPYEQAVANTVIPAAVIRRLLLAMIEKGVQAEQIHLIGHSLGAHISSYVGRDLPNLGRISGLDPAGPEFYTSDSSDRLDSRDALFVDVLHTDGAPRAVSGFGYLDEMGHVDFYPNGGSAQPTCPMDTGNMLLESFWTLFSTLNMENTVDTVACNHMSAVFYYTDSINTVSPAYGYPCSNYSSFVQGLCTSCGSNSNNCQRTGYHASPDRTLGNLYMMTLHGVQAPHFGFQFKVTLASAMDTGKQTRGTFKIKFNEKDEEVQLLDQNTLMKHNSLYSKTILTANDPTPIPQIFISFQKSYGQNFGFGLADDWNFGSITVLNMQTNKEYMYCPTPASAIKSGSQLKYHACSSLNLK